MNGWSEFLEARMKIIQEAVKAGLEPSQIEDLVNIQGMQTRLLIENARMANEKEK